MNIKSDKLAEENDDEIAELEEYSRGNPESWFLETGELSDVTVLCGRKTFRLHKCIFDRVLDDNDESLTTNFCSCALS